MPIALILAAGVLASLGCEAPAEHLAVGETRGAVKSSTLSDLWNHSAHFVANQTPAPVQGSQWHREFFPVRRADLGAQTIYLYHRCNLAQPSICLSISSNDGASFGAPQQLILPRAGYFSVSPSVAKVGNTWTMVYEEGGTTGVSWATSDDGLAWTVRNDLFPATPLYRATPGIFVSGSTVYVFYAEQVSAGHLSIKFSSGPSMTSLTDHGGYVLTPGAANTWDAGSVSMPRVYFDGTYYWMIYEGGSVDLYCGTANSNVMGVGLARSTNLTSWTKYDWNPIFQSTDSETCGPDMPGPAFPLSTGQLVFYHTTDGLEGTNRDALVSGIACSHSKSYPNYREKNQACLPSCGGLGGTWCGHVKSCPNGYVSKGQSYDCASCCAVGGGCTPNCTGQACGATDGCGGTCCAGSGCTSVSCPTCQTPNACGSACVNVADGTTCAGGTCQNGTCQAGCTPSCAGKACGASDGCGGTCCAGSGCTTVSCPTCQTPNACGSACVNVANGTTCAGGTCQNGTCQAGCTPSCAGKTCGASDGCSGTCCAGSGCTTVSCPTCQTPNACGSACVVAADGAACSGGLCKNGSCLPTCGGAGGTVCEQNGNHACGNVGPLTYDCDHCCGGAISANNSCGGLGGNTCGVTACSGYGQPTGVDGCPMCCALPL